MRRRITLYIEGIAADLTDDALVLFTYTREDLDNPATIRNAYTKQITIPGTPNNVSIFNEFGRSDRATGSAGGGIGRDFNALKRLSFTIYDERSVIIEEGYLKLDTVQEDAHGIRSYTVTLFGGLGGFMYSLMYDSSGNKRSLASLWYLGEGVGNPEDEVINVNANATWVRAFWAYVDDGLGAIGDRMDCFGFIPAYNGTPPSFFDSQKAFQKTGSTYGLPVPTGQEPIYQGALGNLTRVSYPVKQTEWATRDLRAYLQRPVVRIRAIIDAICQSYNNGGYTVNLDATFFDDSNPYYNDAWMTLPLLDYEAIRGSSTRAVPKSVFLACGISPADVLLSFAKMFGLVFVMNQSTRTVYIMQRAEFYTGNGGVVDLTSRADISGGVETVPFSFTNRFLTFKQEQYGIFAEQYADAYGRTFGSMRVDTGYEFNAEDTDVLSGSAFKGAPEARESSKYFCRIAPDSVSQVVPSPMIDAGVKYSLKDSGTGKISDVDAPTILQETAVVSYFDNSYPLVDLVPKVQLHGADNAPQTGDGVLVFYRGWTTLPANSYCLTDDVAALTSLNNGVPCWLPDYWRTDSGTLLSSLPVFGRYRFGTVSAGVTTYDKALDFGVPAEIAQPDVAVAAGAGIYSQYWAKYIGDRLDADAMVVRMKVDFSKLEVGAGLLGKFYYWRGALWVLNKISDYSLTTYDLPTCEFIRVEALANYQSL